MLKKFKYWKKLHDSDNLKEFTTNKEGLLWLKIKSIARKELMKEFLEKNNIQLNSKTILDQFTLLFEQFKSCKNDAHQLLDDFINEKDKECREKINQEKLISELYKLENFDWGGDYKNALDKYLVDRYIKKCKSYDILNSKLDNEINQAVRGYVFCSWYNHWSSILIENIFKSHSNVLPTVGQIKKVDFFINQIPFDLKVTYLPDNFIASKRKYSKLKSELSELKNLAKEEKIIFDKDAKDSQIYHEIKEKIKDSKNVKGLEILNEIKKFRLSVLEKVRQNPELLIKNLYENQGEMRFDASNRLFLILVNTKNFEDSWKLKRNVNMLKKEIFQYLNNFNHKKLKDLEINFTYKNKGNFTAFSDIVWLIE